MDKKYKLTEYYIVNEFGKKLYRIKALKDFSDVEEGEFGGFVESENNLSQEGDCWVYDDARVYDNVKIYGSAKIREYSKIFNSVEVFDNAEISGISKVYGNAKVYGSAIIGGYSKVFGNSLVHGIAKLEDNNEYKDVNIYKRN